MKGMEYTITRKHHRKTISIVILPDKSIEIRAPFYFNDREIDSFASSKREWIARRISELNTAEYTRPHHQYIQGENFLFMGKHYSLELNRGRRGVVISGRSLFVTAPTDTTDCFDKEVVKAILQDFFISKAREILRLKTTETGKLYNMQPVFISVKDYRSRWGCCFSDGRIFYNWKIIFAPETIIDYVVTHELCHLRMPNHSKKYWELVGKIIPDWQEKRKWLRMNSHALDL